jgi:hypothetical protein
MDDVIDSDKAAIIIQEQDIPDTAQPYALGVNEIVSTHDTQHFAWDFLFQMPDDAFKSVSVDMLTGEVIHNEFAEATLQPLNKTRS